LNWAKELQLKPEELENYFLLKNKNLKTALHMAENNGQFEVLEKLWNWIKELQLKPEELKNEMLLKITYDQTAWHIAAKSDNVEVLEKLWN
jgi:ankyrin repeat protein